MNFIENYDVDKLKTADYNPREIKENSFEYLKESLTKFGICKPLIINKNNTLVAGHQRTKAIKELNFKNCPVFILNKKAELSDEIKFNLIHNSVETETSKNKISCDVPEKKFSLIAPENIQILKKGNGKIIKEIGKLINIFGEFGSIIINENGEVIHNNDYAYISKLLNKDLIVYKINNNDINSFNKYMNVDYGEYHYSNLNIKSYNQTYCQMDKGNKFKGKNKFLRSSLYEKYVLKNLKKEDYIIDFGAGQLGYYKTLKKLGYNISAYEPFYRGDNSNNLKISCVVKMINNLENMIANNGLFNKCVLDSVLNSIVHNDFEHHVLTTCNSLLNKEGVLYVSTRNRNESKNNLDHDSISRNKGRDIRFFDKNDFTGTFVNGVWTLQKFHTINSLKNLLEKYFKKVIIPKQPNKASQIYAIAYKPKILEKNMRGESLNIEFNMEYPNGHYHNKHKNLIKTILSYHI